MKLILQTFSDSVIVAAQPVESIDHANELVRAWSTGPSSAPHISQHFVIEADGIAAYEFDFGKMEFVSLTPATDASAMEE